MGNYPWRKEKGSFRAAFKVEFIPRMMIQFNYGLAALSERGLGGVCLGFLTQPDE